MISQRLETIEKAGDNMILYKSFSELDKSNLLGWVKNDYPQLYAFKYKQRYSKYPDDIAVNNTLQASYEQTYNNWQRNEWIITSPKDLFGDMPIIKEKEPHVYAYKFKQNNGYYPKDYIEDTKELEVIEEVELCYLLSLPYSELMNTDGMERAAKINSKAARAMKP